ncbi:phosphopantetheine binding protein [Paenibacillus cellulosilyticus]|uniref:Phosphopantetheine binding protein n=1 Tax=Paenibacillus cellulosilyticus TaxID=375489 RepID=A0A2V2YYW9_9BACL|nr:SDR family NAD(P)-dependent oxidoreductase [Paenibacillus cellulosilyticus]PWW07330.1 phosphopantetheine binding protein [Paenibacillus cellulosilyticus]QKS44491.1 SDR family NAD(P)-dependent oxidoreductase [Paenibacillus cellulosilyticus]
MEQIYKYVVENIRDGKINKGTAVELLKMLKGQERADSKDIAIIGMDVRLPFADSTEDFWKVIESGTDCIGPFPSERVKDLASYYERAGQAADKVRFADGAYLHDVDKFDYRFFKLSPKEASLMDPNQRIFLETVWRTIEDAGYGGTRLAGSKTGVYVGYASNVRDSYSRLIYDTKEFDATSIVGNLSAILPSRISYYLDLKGPTMVVDTACSSSLVSVKLACDALRNGQCDMAIAGGVKLSLFPEIKANEKIGIESSDGRTRAFDDRADGAGTGEGVAAILLKPLRQALKDGDQIYAVIKGAAVNQDGYSIGITAPNPASQAEVLAEAWNDAGIDPETIAYIETHGTGTHLGDPIEVKGISNAFARFTDRKQFCAISSLKTSTGHLYEAAGIANLIKAVLALRNSTIPSTNNFKLPNRTIPFSGSPVYVNAGNRKWLASNHPRRCGVSSFGISGTNCHIVLEEAPQPSFDVSDKTGPFIFTMSAHSKQSLKELACQYSDALHSMDARTSLEVISYTVTVGRGHYGYRVAFPFESLSDLRNKVDKFVESAENDGIANPPIDQKKEKTAEWRIIQNKAKQLVARLAKQEERTPEGWSELCEVYKQGADIQWPLLFEGAAPGVVRLPAYVFDKLRCWAEFDSVGAAAEKKLFYRMNWKPEPFEKSSLRVETPVTGTMLVFNDHTGLGRRIAQVFKDNNCDVVEVDLGHNFEQTEYGYKMESSEESFLRLIDALKGRQISRIVHLWGLGRDNPTHLDELRESQQAGLYSLFYMTKALINEYPSKDTIQMTVIGDSVFGISGEEKEIKPSSSSMFGLAKVITQEYPHLKCRCLDVGELPALEQITNEIEYPSLKSFLVGLRGDKRFVEQFEEWDRKPDSVPAYRWKTDGVYVLTGGTGGIGLEIADSIADYSGVKMALLGRTPLPPRQQWEAVLASSNDTESVERIKKMIQLERKGAKVAYYSVDIAEMAACEELFAKLRDTYGTINGVIHGAGIPGDGFLARKSEERFAQVIEPKIDGCWILDQITDGDDLDFFIIFSSGVSIIGEIGQGDYVAANSYLDAFSAYRKKRGKPSVTIDWVSWKSAGMAVKYGFNKDLIFKAIDTKSAVEAFHKVIQAPIDRLVIGEPHVEGEHFLLLEHMEFHLSDAFKTIIAKQKALNGAKVPGVAQAITATIPDVKLTGRDEGIYSDFERTIGGFYREILGFNEIDVFDSFFELGGDSVMLSKLHQLIEHFYPGSLKLADLFTFTSVSKLAAHIGLETQDNRNIAADASRMTFRATESEDIAVIGLAARLPMADNADQYYENIRAGIDCAVAFPEYRKQDMNEYLSFAEGTLPADIRYHNGAFLDRIDEFDYRFFKLTPAEAKLMDPHQRLFLQTVWHAIEDAGYGGGKLVGSKTGVYMGFAGNIKDSYQKLILDADPESIPISAVGNIVAMMPSRISYLLDLTGPTMVIDTACSSTLVALHTACMGMKRGDCETALVGGVRINLLPLDREYMKIGIESSNGRTMTFDETATGSGSGEGVTAVMLKPLSQAVEDGDQIYCVIKGSSINQDGASIGITAPNPEAQTKVLLRAWEASGVSPESLAFIEAHGTATALGDPIEIKALQQAFEKYTDKKHICAIGTVKTNVGHLYEGAGLAGFIKAAMALKHREVPPTINFHKPNSRIDFSNSPVYVNRVLRKWTDAEQPMRCAVSSFGFSGTNCHIVMEEAPANEVSSVPAESFPFMLSANSTASLVRMLDDYLDRLNRNATDSLAGICYTVATGRDHKSVRLAFAVRTSEELVSKLTDARIRLQLQPIQALKKEEVADRVRHEMQRQVEEWVGKAEDGYAPDRAEWLEKLCELYIAGAYVPWERLYKGMHIKKVSLPGYAFERNRCWLDIPKGVAKAAANRVESGGEDTFYALKWESLPLVTSDEPSLSEGVVLVLSDGNPISGLLASRFREKGMDVLEAEFGDRFEQKAQWHYVVRGDEEDFIRLLEPHASGLRRIVQAIGFGASPDSLEELERNQHIGTYSLFQLARAVAKLETTQEMDIVLLTETAVKVTGEEACIRPEQATLAGLGKAVRKEHANLICRNIDIDPETPAVRIAEEIDCMQQGIYRIAYRQGQRYAEKLEAVDMAAAPEKPVELRENGVYVVTGGLGGIGLEVAKYLAARQKVRLMMINRTPMPDRREWADLVESGEDVEARRKIEAIRQIEELGAQVDCFSADVADLPRMREVMGDIKARHGVIHGVIHGAGVGGAELITNRKAEDFRAVFSPKVHGTWILGELTRNEKLDFFVLFSSIATLITAPGQGDYIAANAYLDAFAQSRSNRGERALAINWSTWRETGMSVKHNFTVDTLFKSISTKNAIERFDDVFHRSISNVLIGEIHFDGPFVRMLKTTLFGLSDPLKNRVDARTSSNKGDSRSSGKKEVRLSGDESQSNTEAKLGQICQSFLGFDEMDVHDNFFELGADSIILTRMQAQIDKEYPGIVNITDIFEHTTIYKLAQFIDGKLIAAEPMAEESAPDELRTVFDELLNDHMSPEKALEALKRL